jgi:anti-sigma factor RsiW
MDCNKFQDSITDYLDGAVDSRARAECAAHRLTCRECRELYNDVKATVEALAAVAQREIAEPEGLEGRIIAATTAGEMLSCGDFDRMIERYFDGVILAPTFQTFQAHFEKCAKCRRLMSGIDEVIAMCKEIKEAEVEMPESLHDRIVAATVGEKNRGLAGVTRLMSNWLEALWTPQIAAAALIFAASGLLILSRFGSIGVMASRAGIQAETLVSQGQRAINHTGAMARSGFMKVSYEVNTLFADGGETKPGAETPTGSQRRDEAQRGGESEAAAKSEDEAAKRRQGRRRDHKRAEP